MKIATNDYACFSLFDESSYNALDNFNFDFDFDVYNIKSSEKKGYLISKQKNRKKLDRDLFMELKENLVNLSDLEIKQIKNHVFSPRNTIYSVF